ncbi:D-amino acid dehydrogenase small subunit [Pigmentiphaga humi]|uniref:D-amino acid dehydrogenase small subunit n=1 Tax=Pigmentiphaga humi TaxID=2478468 RepID=A0A3P4B7T3_9BURK|nr:FAD-dependent oxidoreductase [Pigmentiphaga humi]VCU71991.1 D-amino acid dehydrogenase small subunit [Pigmentiphaga humi]
MHVIVIGAGIVGVCTAYWLNRHGMQVTVLDRRSGIAQEASFGSAGLAAADHAAPWACPGMPRHLASYMFKAEQPAMLRPAMDPRHWGWLRAWLRQCQAERYAGNLGAMQRLARYSRTCFAELQERHGFEYERRNGTVQLLRSQRDVERSKPARQLMQEHGIPHQLLTPEQAIALDPHLRDASRVGTPLAGAIYYPGDDSGNCPLYARLLAAECERNGVVFRFNAMARPTQDIRGAVAGVQLHDGQALAAQAVVMANGSDATAMLVKLGVRAPLLSITGHAATVPLRDDAIGPRRAFIDQAYGVSFTPLGHRLRIASTTDLGGRRPGTHDKARRTLARAARDWLPGVLDFSRATWWSGACATTPDGPPILGRTRLPGLYLNIGHGAHGWGMAPGAGRIVADAVAGREPGEPLDGLDIARYARKNRG